MMLTEAGSCRVEKQPGQGGGNNYFRVIFVFAEGGSASASPQRGCRRGVRGRGIGARCASCCLAVSLKYDGGGELSRVSGKKNREIEEIGLDLR